MNCKDLNIKLCDDCLELDRAVLPLQYTSTRACYIHGWMDWFKKFSASEIINVLSLRITNYPNDNFYCLKALEIYDPKLFENINKLMILI
jgi:hypothetical protein